MHDNDASALLNVGGGPAAGSGRDGGAGPPKASPNGDLPDPMLALGCPASIPDAGS